MKRITAVALFVVGMTFLVSTPAKAQSYTGQFGTMICDSTYQSCAVPAINACMMAQIQDDAGGALFAPDFGIDVYLNFWDYVLTVMDFLGF